MKTISWFTSICNSNGLTLDEEQVGLFETYLRLLLSWNSRINLISRKDEDNFYSHHALNCVSFLFGTDLKPNARILDLGTGGGLPGIPLKILRRDLSLVLLDSVAKKTAALSDIVRKMELEEVEVVNGRAENVAKLDEFQGKFDYVISRAAGRSDEVIKWSRGFPKKFESLGNRTIPAGTLMVLKGGAIEDELRVARSLKIVESIRVTNITFNGMDEIENKDKKLIVVQYKTTAAEKRN